MHTTQHNSDNGYLAGNFLPIPSEGVHTELEVEVDVNIDDDGDEVEVEVAMEE